MIIEDSVEHITWVDLPPEPEMRNELQRLVKMAVEGGSKDMGIDFSCAEIVTSASLASLVRLHKLASRSGAGLVLCNISPTTQSIFAVTGLSELFDVSDDRHGVIVRIGKHKSAQVKATRP